MLLIQRLNSKKMLLADGAMGTQLQSRGLSVGESSESWNLSHPDIVREIAQAYASSGSDILYTNTFGANRLQLEKKGLEGELKIINHIAVKLAREVSAELKPCVVGSMGPSGEFLYPLGSMKASDLADIYKEQAEVLLEAGVDGLVLETFSALDEILLALQTIRNLSESIPVIASMSYGPRAKTLMGVSAIDAAVQLLDNGADVVGANCSEGPDTIESAVKMMKTARPDSWFLAKPNAGLPQWKQGKTVYSLSPEDMAEFARKAKSMGVKIVGGCCGSTPEHIKAMSEAIKEEG
jgi:methionine synthase I (cobalamin-dependent)